MKVIISGIDFSADIGPLVKEFYPGADIEISYRTEEELPDDPEEDALIIRIWAYEEELRIAFGKEPCVTGTFSYVDVPDEHMKYEKRKRRAYKNFLLRELYRLISKETQKELPWGILTGVRPTKLAFERLKRKEEDSVSFMMGEYFCSHQKAVMAHDIALSELNILNSFNYKEGYSLYVGFPFCPSICNYCSFGSHPIDKFGNLVQDYIDALLKEIEECSPLLRDRELQTIYFGGGTPTAVSAVQLKTVIDKVKECFDIRNVLEFCVEAGRPDSIDRDKLSVLKEEGITRISVNPQTMRDETLKLIGRKHSVQETVEAFRLARDMGFDNINMDLIAGLSGESFPDMCYTLDRVRELGPDSITVHTLALKRAARLSTEKDCFSGAEAEDVEKMVDYASKFCMENGYKPYYLYRQKNMTGNLENVGYARPGKEGLYNILIMEEVQMILALGAGASSKFTDFEKKSGRRFGRVENVKNVREYIDRIDEMIERKKIAFQGRRV